MKRKRLITTIIVIILIAVAFLIFIMSRNRSYGPVVKTAEVTRGDITSAVFTTGQVKPAAEEEINAQVSGIISDIHVKRGDKVKEGQLLVEVDCNELEQRLKAADLKYKTAEAEYRFAVEELAGKKADISREYQKTKLEYDQALSEYEANIGLHENGAVSKNDLELSKNRVSLLEIQLTKVREQLTKLEDKEYYDNLMLAKNLNKEQSFEEMKGLQLEFESSRIKATISGTVLEIFKGKGAAVQPGISLFLIGDMRSLEIEGQVNEFDVPSLQVGQEVRVTGDGFIGRDLKGILKEIAPAAVTYVVGRSGQTTVEVVVELKDPDQSIKPGFSANMEIITNEEKDILILPLECIKNRDGKKFVYIVDKNNIIQERAVETGISNELYTKIVKGLVEGEIAIMSPDESLEPGQKVIIK